MPAAPKSYEGTDSASSFLYREMKK